MSVRRLEVSDGGKVRTSCQQGRFYNASLLDQSTMESGINCFGFFVDIGVVQFDNQLCWLLYAENRNPFNIQNMPALLV
jgi:hypothetical protein